MLATSAYSLLYKKENAHVDHIYCCAWTQANLSDDESAPPKDIIVTAGSMGIINVWEWGDNKLQLRTMLKDHRLAVTSLSFSPDGLTLVSTAMDFCLNVWDMVSGERVHKIPAPSVWKATFAPDGMHIVTGCHSGELVIYNVVKGSVVTVIDTSDRFAIDVSWSPNDQYIASGSTSGTVYVLDSVHGKIVHRFRDHRESIKSVEFSPNSKVLLTSSTDGSFKLYDVKTGVLLHSLHQPAWALSACFAPDGKRVALATAAGEVMLALVDGLQVLRTFEEHDDDVCQVQFNPKGDKVISVSKDKSINIYDCPSPYNKKATS
ncbi:uncharacterized protein [Epargyreus clarus]|uniref:uncharacterized protein n=1 Tax=Epargyreus clarus TaxID=520877 RepID=UPI003C30475E